MRHFADVESYWALAWRLIEVESSGDYNIYQRTPLACYCTYHQPDWYSKLGLCAVLQEHTH